MMAGEGSGELLVKGGKGSISMPEKLARINGRCIAALFFWDGGGDCGDGGGGLSVILQGIVELLQSFVPRVVCSSSSLVCVCGCVCWQSLVGKKVTVSLFFLWLGLIGRSVGRLISDDD